MVGTLFIGSMEIFPRAESNTMLNFEKIRFGEVMGGKTDLGPWG